MTRQHPHLKFPTRYVPKHLTSSDKQRQVAMLLKSRKLYKNRNRKYYTRKELTSYKNKKSKHSANMYKIYGISKMTPNRALSAATGCKISALKQIVKKGEGAYYSSGSRPNQSPQSWGFARLASSLTAGKAAAVDYDIIDKGCDHKKRAFKYANKARKLYGHGTSPTRKISI